MNIMNNTFLLYADFRMICALRKLIFRHNEALPSAGKLFLWQFSWIIPYLLVS